MLNKKKRGLLATAGALVTAAALALGGAAAANAAPGDPVTDMPASSAVVITKYDSTPGNPATGLPQEVPGGTIEGVSFAAYAVPVQGGTPLADLTPGTNEWQEAVAAITPAAAAALVGASPTAVRTGITDTHGIIVWADEAVVGVDSAPQDDNLDRGLYLVRETAAPAGVVPSNDFLLAVPLTHPTALDSWLDTIYVYPKNRLVNGTKTVTNATDFVVGDTVTWKIDIDNPSGRDSATGTYIPSDKFLILDTIKDEFLTETAVRVTAPAGLVAVTDYNVTRVTGDGTNGAAVGYTQIQINFTEAGLTKLAAAINGAPSVGNVVVEIDTTVNKVGVIENSAQFYSSENQTEPTLVPPTHVKYGNVVLNKKSTDIEVTDLSGATFRVYLSEAAAQAKSNVAYDADTTPDGYLVTAENATGLWETGTDGKVTLGGFRYSGYADGAVINEGEDGYQTYWLAEIDALDGHQLLGAPVEFTVGDATDSAAGDLTVLEYDVTNAKDGGFVLPLTGGTGTLLLTILGVGILAVVLVVARRRNAIATTE